MITCEVNHNDLAYIERKLGSLKKNAPRALRDAVNRTAVSARRRLLNAARQRYTVKASGFNSRVKINPRATLASPTAVVRAEGRPLTMARFRFTHPKSGVRAEIISGTGLKAVVGPHNIKAFVSRLASGKVKTNQVLQRVGPSRYPIQVLRSPSVPKQIEMVYDGRKIANTPLKMEIELLYRKNVEQQIARFLNQ